MVRLFRDGSGYMVQTTCLEIADYLPQLGEAIAEMSGTIKDEVDRAIATQGILEKAMPIAFRLAGYKADAVNEQRTLVCGYVSPQESKVIATAGG